MTILVNSNNLQGLRTGNNSRLRHANTLRTKFELVNKTPVVEATNLDGLFRNLKLATNTGSRSSNNTPFLANSSKTVAYLSTYRPNSSIRRSPGLFIHDTSHSSTRSNNKLQVEATRIGIESRPRTSMSSATTTYHNRAPSGPDLNKTNNNIKSLNRSQTSLSLLSYKADSEVFRVPPPPSSPSLLYNYTRYLDQRLVRAPKSVVDEEDYKVSLDIKIMTDDEPIQVEITRINSNSLTSSVTPDSQRINIPTTNLTFSSSAASTHTEPNKSSTMAASKPENFAKFKENLETHAYLQEKKNLNDKIHDHWKLELEAHPKGQPLNKVNDKVYNTDWMTISTQASQPTNETTTSTTDAKLSSLIEAFTATLNQGEQNQDSVYQVNGHVGTFIAQKLLNGEKIRVGHNGQAVSSTVNVEAPAERRKNSIELLLENAPKTNKSILSWNDQINRNSECKIIEPKGPPPPEEKKLKPERYLTVKKLTDEEEFKPKVHKSPLENKEYQTMLQQHQKLIQQTQPPLNSERGSGESKKNQSTMEVIGMSSSSLSNKINKHQKQSSGVKLDSSRQYDEDDDTYYVMNSTGNTSSRGGPVPTMEPTLITQKMLVPSKKSKIKKQDENSALNENSYLQIIDNLTSRYSNNSSNNNPAASLTTTSLNVNNKPVKSSINTTIEPLNLKDYLLKDKNSISSIKEVVNSSNTDELIKPNPKVLKLLEKKYRNALQPISVNNSTSDRSSVVALDSTSRSKKQARPITVLDRMKLVQLQPHKPSIQTGRLPQAFANNVNNTLQSDLENARHQAYGGGFFYTSHSNPAYSTSYPQNTQVVLTNNNNYQANLGTYSNPTVTNRLKLKKNLNSLSHATAAKDNKYMQVSKPFSPMFRQLNNTSKTTLFGMRKENTGTSVTDFDRFSNILVAPPTPQSFK